MKHKITIAPIHFEQWDEGQYRLTIKTMRTALGNWMWNVADLSSGHGFGGFAMTETEARTALNTKLAELRGEVD